MLEFETDFMIQSQRYGDLYGQVGCQMTDQRLRRALWVRPSTEDEEGGGDPGKRVNDTRCLSSYEQTGKMGQDGPLYLNSHRDCI